MPPDLPNDLKPGQRLERVLSQLPLHEHPTILDNLERKYRAEGALDMLREVKAYRRLSAEAPPRAK